MEQEFEADERHPFRVLVKFAIFAGLLYAAGRFLAQKKEEYADLTESQARDKLINKMGPRVGDETAEDIANQVIPKLKDRGFIKSDPVDESKDASDKVGEAVNSVVKD